MSGAGIAGAVLAASAVLALGCGGPDDDELIRGLIESGRAAAESGDLATFRDIVADDYGDDSGRDRATVLSLVGAYLRQYPSRYVMARVRSISVDGDAATADLLVAVAGTPFDGIEGLRSLDGDVLRVTLELTRSRGRWRVVAAAWADARPADLL